VSQTQDDPETDERQEGCDGQDDPADGVMCQRHRKEPVKDAVKQVIERSVLRVDRVVEHVSSIDVLLQRDHQVAFVVRRQEGAEEAAIGIGREQCKQRARRERG